MILTLEEVKNYLRVDFEDDDELITQLIKSSEKRCYDILRVEKVEDETTVSDEFKIGVFYAVAYIYENRENADYNKLNLTLRALLNAERKEVF